MVGFDFKGGEDGCHYQSRQILAAEGQHDARNQRRQIGQCHHLPDVSGSDDNQEIGAESPQHGTEGGEMAAEVEGAQQDIETQKIGKKIPHIVGQPQMIGVGSHGHGLGTLVRGGQLVGGHSAKQAVGPARHLAGALLVLVHLLSRTPSGRTIVLVKDAPLYVGREEIGE